MEEESTALYRHDPKYTAGSPTSEAPCGTGQNEEKGDTKGGSSGRLILGYLGGVMMALSWSTSASCSQALGGFVPMFELSAWRFAGLLLYTTPAILLKKSSIEIDRKQGVALAFCSFSALATTTLYYEATIYIPVGAFGGLEATCLIVLATLITAVLQRSFRLLPLTTVLVALIGIICLTQPVFLFKSFGRVTGTYTTPVCVHPPTNIGQVANETCNVANISNINNNTFGQEEARLTSYEKRIDDPLKGYFLLVGASVGLVLINEIRHRHLQGIDIVALLFGTSLAGTAVSTTIMLCTETLTFPASSKCIALLLGHSFSAAIASIAETFVSVTVKPVTFSLLWSLQLVFFLVAQYSVLQDVNPGHRNFIEIVGGIMVFIATAIEPVSILYKQWKERGTKAKLSI